MSEDSFFLKDRDFTFRILIQFVVCFNCLTKWVTKNIYRSGVFRRMIIRLSREMK